MKFTPTTQVSGGIFLHVGNKVIIMLSLVVFHLNTPILNCFAYFLWAYFLTDSEFSCLAMLAKPYLASGPTYLPRIPNQLHWMSNAAHEVLRSILLARLMSVFFIKSFVLFIFE